MVRKKKESLKGELAPLFEGNSNTQEILPLFGEEILIRKRIRQVGEAVITKRKVTENIKIPLSTRNEKVIIRYPDGTETDITSRILLLLVDIISDLCRSFFRSMNHSVLPSNPCTKYFGIKNFLVTSYSFFCEYIVLSSHHYS